MKHTKNNVPVIHSHLLGKVNHGFFTRKGGVSTGLFSSLNCGKIDQDDPENVNKNRQTVKEAMEHQNLPLVLVRQAHTPNVITVTDPWTNEDAPEADAMVTQNPNCILGVLTADCVPVLLHDSVSRTIAAVHSGWRGAFSGIIENTVQAMVDIGAKTPDIQAAIGPCITAQSYEVGKDFYKNFLKQDPNHDQYFEDQESPERLYFDLPKFVEDRLTDSGVKSIERMPYDTYDNADLFFSCRRAAHSKEETFGLQISTISLQPMEK